MEELKAIGIIYKKCDENIFFLILRAINAIEIVKNRVLLFVLTRHFTTLKKSKEEFLIIVPFTKS